MMKRMIAYIGVALLVLLGQGSLAGSGLLFNVAATGAPGNVSITLCLNGKGPLSCQNYTVSALTLSISTAVPNHVYPGIGIKINTPGYTLANLGIDCSPFGNGYCLFSASSTTPKTLTMNGGIVTLSVSPSSLPAGTLNTAYSQTVMASAGTAPYTYAITSGSLPTGLSLNAATGVISGTPTTDSTYPFTVTATDANANTGSQAYSVVVSGPLPISPSAVPAATLNVLYNQLITASAGVAPYTYAITSGSLPVGLSLNTSTGVISGTPTTDSTYNFTITATDANSDTGSKAYMLVVSGPLPISPSTLPTGTRNTAYSQTVTASGGVAPYTYAVTSGSLPTGLALNTSTGVISGTPTTDGTSPFTVTATDANSDTGSQAYSVVISGPLTMSPSTLPGATLSTAYSQTVTASGGVAPYTYAITSGSLPTGLSLNVSTGVISGTPTVSDTYNFTVTGTDANSDTGSQAYSIQVGFTFSRPSGIVLNSSGTIAFITNGGTNQVIQCTVTGASLTNCGDSGATGLSTPYSIVLNSAGTIAFVANDGGSTVTQCTVSGSTLSACANSGATGLSAPIGIVLNSAGTIAFIGSDAGGTVTQCTVSGGTLSACGNSGATGLSDPNSITLNSAGTIAFIPNYTGTTVSQCTVSGSTLSACANSGATLLTNPIGIVLNSAGTIAFITNFGGGTVTECSVSGGALSSCANSGGTGFTEPFGITLNPAGTFAFITNFGGTTVSECAVSGGTLSSCAAAT